MNKDVSKINIPPIDAQRCGVKDMTYSDGVFSQDVENPSQKFLQERKFEQQRPIQSKLELFRTLL